MTKFPVDAPIRKVVKAFECLGFRVLREGIHIAMVRENPDGTRTPLTMPNHRRLKGSTLRTILTQAGIPREEFMEAYRDARWMLHLSMPLMPVARNLKTIIGY